jgi:hypothetical protein
MASSGGSAHGHRHHKEIIAELNKINGKLDVLLMAALVKLGRGS